MATCCGLSNALLSLAFFLPTLSRSLARSAFSFSISLIGTRPLLLASYAPAPLFRARGVDTPSPRGRRARSAATKGQSPVRLRDGAAEGRAPGPQAGAPPPHSGRRRAVPPHEHRAGRRGAVDATSAPTGPFGPARAGRAGRHGRRCVSARDRAQRVDPVRAPAPARQAREPAR